MQLQAYWRILRRRGWIMLLLAIITAAAAYGFSEIMVRRAPVYRSTIKVLVQPLRTDFGQAQAAKMLLDSYVAWMDSNYRAQEVINALDLDMEAGALRSDVKIASEAQRLVIQIEVEQPNPAVASDIARKWAEGFIQWRDMENQKVRREDRIEAQIIDDPVAGLESPKKMINTAAGGIFGFLVGLALVFALEYVEAGIVRAPEDVNRFLSLPVLGAIPPNES
jgi:capsular polysaccharide biosynthesis protein